MARILVTGVSGLLGSNLAAVARSRHAVVGVYHRHPFALDGVHVTQTDLTRPEAAAELIAEKRPDWVVHCAAATDVDRCEREPEWAREHNVRMAAEVAAASQAAGARLAHISTDAVFDGERGDYREQDPPEPINVYGHTKLAGERAVLNAHPQALVLRTNLYGWSPDGRRGLAQWFADRLEAGQTCPGFTDVSFSPLYAGQLAESVLALMEQGVGGVLHLAGRTCLSKYEFGVRLAQALGFKSELVEPASVEQAQLAAPRPKRLCLENERAERLLGDRLPDIDVGLRLLAEQRELWREVRQRSAEYAHD